MMLLLHCGGGSMRIGGEGGPVPNYDYSPVSMDMRCGGVGFVRDLKRVDLMRCYQIRVHLHSSCRLGHCN